MKTHLSLLTLGAVLAILILPFTPVHAGPPALPPFQEETATEEPITQTLEETTPKPSAIYPIDIINAVNDLRARNGLTLLATHQALMDVAAQTANALAATEGAAGHIVPAT